MLVSGHGGVLPCPAAAEAPNSLPTQLIYSSNLDLDDEILLPRSAPTAPRQPTGDDAAAAFPVAPTDADASSRRSNVDNNSSVHGVSSTSCHKGSSMNTPYSQSPLSPNTAVHTVARHCSKMDSVSMLAADAKAPRKEGIGLSRVVNMIFSGSRNRSMKNRNGSMRRGSRQQLLLPCLLGDPFVCLNVDKRVGVAAGTLLGRLSLFYWPTMQPDQQQQQQDEQHQELESRQKEEPMSGEVLLPQAYSDDGVAICWTDTSYLTAVVGASDVSLKGDG